MDHKPSASSQAVTFAQVKSGSHCSPAVPYHFVCPCGSIFCRACLSGTAARPPGTLRCPSCGASLHFKTMPLADAIFGN